MAAPIAINQNDITMKTAMKTAIVQNKSAINQKKYLTYRKKWYKVQAKYENCNEKYNESVFGAVTRMETKKEKKKKKFT